MFIDVSMSEDVISNLLQRRKIMTGKTYSRSVMSRLVAQP